MTPCIILRTTPIVRTQGACKTRLLLTSFAVLLYYCSDKSANVNSTSGGKRTQRLQVVSEQSVTASQNDTNIAAYNIQQSWNVKTCINWFGIYVHKLSQLRKTNCAVCASRNSHTALPFTSNQSLCSITQTLRQLDAVFQRRHCHASDGPLSPIHDHRETPPAEPPVVEVPERQRNKRVRQRFMVVVPNLQRCVGGARHSSSVFPVLVQQIWGRQHPPSSLAKPRICLACSLRAVLAPTGRRILAYGKANALSGRSDAIGTRLPTQSQALKERRNQATRALRRTFRTFLFAIQTLNAVLHLGHRKRLPA